MRIPSLSYASDAEVSSLVRTGFIISPDWSLSDEVNLGGTGGALLDDTEGWAIGAKLGYDKQVGNIVVGVITDAFYSFADGDGVGGVFKSELNYYGTVRGRLGYSFGRLMAYGTAGYAYGELEVTGGGASASEMLSAAGPTAAVLSISGTGTSTCTPATAGSISTTRPSRRCRPAKTRCRPRWTSSISD